MKDFIKVLKAIASSKTDSRIDSTSKIDVEVVRQLFDAGLIDAIDMSDLEGNCFDNVKVNVRGHEWLQNQETTSGTSWLKSFDRRIAVIGVIISVIALYLGLK